MIAVAPVLISPPLRRVRCPTRTPSIGDGVIFARLHDAADDAVVGARAHHGYFRAGLDNAHEESPVAGLPLSSIVLQKTSLVRNLAGKPVR